MWELSFTGFCLNSDKLILRDSITCVIGYARKRFAELTALLKPFH
ncbi:hypothetical protein LEP1GSC043_2964 [Leptospira weilii str. Ecochallenge]|uniref:Uncharacterized protein n=1 Tax=Leptospira weilii str. Ecochallenge TaxID=1049986 RepID=N1U1U1_9LEPT|nr:hypothetical protein LEP1GSC043_2964 [Leptospira weilii str. Ecochallenge]